MRLLMNREEIKGTSKKFKGVPVKKRYCYFGRATLVV